MVLIPASPASLDEITPTPPPPTTSIMSDMERELAEALDALHDWNIDDITVAELASLLNTRMRCRIDENALDEAGLSPDHSLGGLHARQLSTRVALHHLLRDTDLAWMIRDGQLVLTTPEQVEDNLRLLVLPVVDLIETPGMARKATTTSI
jgi:hypothetical protein